jgi:hypothetical protein
MESRFGSLQKQLHCRTMPTDVLVKRGVVGNQTYGHSLRLTEREIGAPMSTSKECRLHAEECLELAKQAEEFYVKTALIELAEDVNSRLKK